MDHKRSSKLRDEDMISASHEQKHSSKTGRAPIGALQIDQVTLSDVADRLSQFIEEGTPHHVVTANVQFVSIASRNPAFAEVVNRADLVVADGLPLVWLSRLSKTPLPERITGHELLHLAACLAIDRGYSISFLGAAPEVAAEAASHLCIMYPGLNFLDTYQGSFSPDGYGLSEKDEVELVRDLRRSRPDFLFVALGCPKQEFWIARHLHDIGIPVCVGIGGVLDVLAGRVSRAPTWMQQVGLEWSFRALQEPHRLWRRYLLESVPTVYKLGVATLRESDYVPRLLRNGKNSVAGAPASPVKTPESGKQG